VFSAPTVQGLQWTYLSIDDAYSHATECSRPTELASSSRPVPEIRANGLISPSSHDDSDIILTHPGTSPRLPTP